MADYIDREAVCYQLEKQATIDGQPRAIRRARKIVSAFPAADVVERKRGEWIGFPENFKFEHIYDRDAIVCPFCEESWNIVDNDTERFNFCPNCGADMRPEERKVTP